MVTITPSSTARLAIRSNACANGHIGPFITDAAGNKKCRACGMTVMGG